jgi:anaerobic magnesium-protoporphyrin IX monomethyl ester cyclase
MNTVEKESTEILFLCPNLDYNKPWDFTFTEHLGASYVRAYLKEKGILAAQFIYREPVELNRLIPEILRYKAEIIGFTIYDTTYPVVKITAERLKKIKPSLTILAGGISATFSDKFILENSPAVDICIRREGEYTVYELIRQLKEGRNISNIKGITYRSNGNIVRNPDRPLIQSQEKGAELDILPSPFLNNVLIPEDNFGLVTSRGCFYRCTYCNFSSMSNWTIRYHSVERVISELKKLSGAVGHVPIFDDTFTLNIARAKQICRRIIEEKINLTFWCQTRADKVDDELLRLMHQAGFKKATFGLESAVPRVLKTVQKVRTNFTVTDDDLEPEKEFIRKLGENVKLAQEVGLDPEVNIIMGLPGATAEDDKETIAFVKNLKINSYVHHLLNIYPGTELFETHEQYGIGLRPSATGLPYNTYRAYDISNIIEMDNAQKLLFKDKQVNLILKIMTGNYKDVSDNNYPDILFKHHSLITAESVDWLKEFTNMNSKVGFLSDRLNDENIRINLKNIISSSTPIFHCYSLVMPRGANTSLSDSCGKHTVAFNTADYSETIGSFIIISLSDYLSNSFSYKAIDPKMRIKIAFILNKICDIEDLNKLVKQKTENESFALSENLLKFGFSFLDACRWLDCDCPAVTFRRALIEEDGSILPCFHAKLIGNIGDSRQEIIERLNELRGKTESERGCNSCSVKESCSKCIFPFPLKAEEFCQIQKKDAVFSDIIKLSKF